MRNSEVRRIDRIEADIGIEGRSTIRSIGEIDARKIGLTGEVQVGSIGTIRAGETAIDGRVTARYIDRIYSERDAVKHNAGNPIEEIREIHARTGLSYESDVKLVSGLASVAESLVYRSRCKTEFHGNIEAGGKLFNQTSDHLIANRSTKAEEVDGSMGDSAGISNLVITENLELEEELNYRSTAITYPEQEGTIDYHGDMSLLVEAARDEGIEFLGGLKKFGTPMQNFSSIVELKEEDERQRRLYERALEETDGDGELGSFTPRTYPLDSIHQVMINQKAQKELDDGTWLREMDISSFGTELSKIDYPERKELIESLMTEKDRKILEGEINEHTGEKEWYSEEDTSIADRMFNIATGREYRAFMDDEASNIQDLLNRKGEIPDTASIMNDIGFSDNKDSSPYEVILEEIIEENREDLELLEGLGEFLDIENDPFESLKPVKKIKDKEAGRRARIENAGLDPDQVNRTVNEDVEDYREWFREEIDSKIKDYLTRALTENGKEEAKKVYKELSGEWKDVEEISDGKLAAMKVYARSDHMEQFERENQVAWSKVESSVRKLFKHEEDVYEIGRNGHWLKQNNYEAEDLIDPDISFEDSDIFEEADGKSSAARASLELGEFGKTRDRRHMYLKQIRKYTRELGVDVDPEEGVDELEHKLLGVDNELRETLKYQEAMEAIDNYRNADETETKLPEDLVFRVAGPVETTLMGQGMQSCHDPESGSMGWASVSNAIEPNTVVMYAGESMDDIQARVKAYITEDDRLVYHHTSNYQKIDMDLSIHFAEYIERVADSLGLEAARAAGESWKDDVELLEAHAKYHGS